MIAYSKDKTGSLLLATDGSEFSEEAVRKGINLAKASGSKVTALTVIEFNPDLEAFSPNFIEPIGMESEAVAHVNSIKERAEKEGVACETLVEQGQPFEVILNKAKEKGANLIVMGSHGRTGVAKLLMGSVTERVIGHSECDVLVVKAKKRISAHI
jgi:nucleotide-binding universal stress UspA family protein